MPPPDPAVGFAQKLALSAVAAGAAETTTYPLDFIKTRMQLAGQQQAAAGAAAAAAAAGPAWARPQAPSRGLLSTAASVVRQEGFMGL